MTDPDLHALLRDVADEPRRLTTTAAIVLAVAVSLTLWFAAAWLACLWHPWDRDPWCSAPASPRARSAA